MKNALSSMKKVLLRTLIILIAVVALLKISGYGYVLTAVNKSILDGHFGPGIYDLDKFPKNEIKPAEKRFEWKEKDKFIPLTSEENEFHKQVRSTSFLVSYADTLLSESYWGEHTLISYSNSFSMAKSITATLCAIAVDKREIKWEDPISLYIEETRGLDIGKLNFHQLLNMSANTSWSESGGNPFSNNAEAYYDTDLKELLLTLEMKGKPGSKFNYQSGNTALAGWALSNAVGISISEYAEQNLWSKIGTNFPAYWSTDEDNNLEKAFCCFYAVSRDFAKLGRLWMNKGQWDSTTTVFNAEQMDFLIGAQEVDYNVCPDVCYGVAFWLENYNGKKFYYARGILGQYVIVIPEEQLIIVRTGHTRLDKNERYHPADLYEYVEQGLRMKTLYEKGHRVS
ncbi:serine hydrolase domain-containing protein [Luteibaculum oceani]|uniref:Serine hydrolase n=1 Tax=Luteibaculum oceani TaxID=1294296 RepID=A0A5C6VK32_9FLAO|nr:serine hydrolase [Luteibaculum oceani]TXC85430.1 serine hydrolase [Luteibaculum oceani]